jgi:hypothetical protein
MLMNRQKCTHTHMLLHGSQCEHTRLRAALLHTHSGLCTAWHASHLSGWTAEGLAAASGCRGCSLLRLRLCLSLPPSLLLLRLRCRSLLLLLSLRLSLSLLLLLLRRLSLSLLRLLSLRLSRSLLRLLLLSRRLSLLRLRLRRRRSLDRLRLLLRPMWALPTRKHRSGGGFRHVGLLTQQDLKAAEPT